MAKANETTAPEKAPAPGPVAPPVTSAAPAPVTVAATAASGKRRWKVSLPWLPPYVVEAASEADAVEAYRREAGIIETEHQYGVEAA